MRSVTVQCSNADQMKLKVTAEFTVGQWKEIVSRVNSSQFYSPLHDEFLYALRRAISSIESREEIGITSREPPPSNS